MLLSIITINRNNAAGLEKTMRSVLSQTYKDIEYIIVDGASTDNSVEVIKSLLGKPTPGPSQKEGWSEGEGNGWHSFKSLPLGGDLREASIHGFWISEPDKGIYNAMNKGIRKATGDYIQILNSGDCLAADDVVERMVGAAYPQPLPKGKGFCMPAGETAISEDLKSLPLGVALPRQTGEPEGGEKTIDDLGEAPTPSPLGEGRGEASILYGNMIKCFPDGRRVQDKCFAGQEISFLGMYTGTLNHSPAYIKRSLFEKYGYYDESLKIVSDWKWYLQAIVLGKTSDIGHRTSEPILASEIRYVDIDVTLFDMTGISETNKELDKAERRMVLEELVPPAILADYDRFAFPIDQIKRLKRHPWAYKMVWFLERCLFKLEKSKKRRSATSQYQ